MEEKPSARQRAIQFALANSDTLVALAKYLLPATIAGAVVSWATWVVGLFGQYSPLSWIVAGLLAALVTALIMVLLATAYRIRVRAKYDARFLGSSGPINPLDKTFDGRRIYLNDFCLPSHPLIEKKTFIDCEIIGPANIFFQWGNNASDNKPPQLDAVLLNGKNTFSNGYIFRDCIFRGCSFQRITLFILPAEYSYYKDHTHLHWISATAIEEPELELAPNEQQQKLSAP